MGATDFYVIAKGKDALSAFSEAVEDARYEYGNGGYTGTIAEKSSFTKFSLPGIESDVKADVNLVLNWVEAWDMGEEDKIPSAYRNYVNKIYNAWGNKWGPAVCFQIEKDKFVFCGLASE